MSRIRRFFQWKCKLTVDFYFKPWYPTHWLWLDAWSNSKHYVVRDGEMVKKKQTG